MHDTFLSCQGCPQREPGCHSRCEGYIYRSEKNKERLQAQNEAYTWVPRREWDKRTRARQEEINRGKR